MKNLARCKKMMAALVKMFVHSGTAYSMFADCQEDCLINLTPHLDVVSFVQLMCTCKYLYSLRKVLIKYLKDAEQFEEYFGKGHGNIIHILLHSYIQLQTYGKINHPSTFADKLDHNEGRMKNTIAIVGFQCWKDCNLFHSYKFDHSVAHMIEKTICKKYYYSSGKKPYERLVNLFRFEWHMSDINIMDICEIMLHIKNRKYQNVMKTITKMQVGHNYLLKTTNLLLKYIQKQEEKTFISPLLCVFYIYSQKNWQRISALHKICNYTSESCANMRYIAENMIPKINNIKTYPQYLKDFFTKTIMDAVTHFEQNKI